MKLAKKTILLIICAFIMSLCINAQEQPKNKNEITLGGGISIPVLKSDISSDNYASSGSNFYVNYGRNVYSKNKGYFTVDFKYISISNPYATLDSDVEEINSSSPASLGVWSGTSDKFKMTSYLVGLGWNKYILKDEKLIFSIKAYLGSGSLTSPNQNFYSTAGYVIEVKEIKGSGFAYSSYGGLSYKLTENIAIGLGIEYLKSSFYFENQELTYSGGGSKIADPYTIKYANLNLNSEFIFKF